ncbi:Sulfate transporter [Sarcoptes scabiei]|uniref:Sulfate transporter n=1 Tax=Sarcoptes scabiei TaxID=52283 RepID=A0A834R7H4_SARSC|nr:Sulfate transporter [Sarcoptes scabiei]
MDNKGFVMMEETYSQDQSIDQDTESNEHDHHRNDANIDQNDSPEFCSSSISSSSLTSFNEDDFDLININRSITLCQDVYPKIDDDSLVMKRKTDCFDSLQNYYRRKRKNFTIESTIFAYVPILNWLPKYDFRRKLLWDFIAGCTVLALNIPQGLAYSHLAGVKPNIGLYVSLFPVLIYVIFGTSRHISIGTFAVISIACKDVLENFELDEGIDFDKPKLFNDETNGVALQPIDVLTALCLLVGIIQFCLGLLKMGLMSIILSDHLTSAFVVSSSIHVFTNQIFGILGIESSDDEEYQLPLPLDIINAYIRFFQRIKNIQWPTLYLSSICLALLLSCKYLIEPFLKRKLGLKNLALPIDIFLVIIVTLISYLMDFNVKYGINIIPEIPTGFAGMPKVPNLSLMTQMIPGAIMICLISYAFTYSLGKMYSKQYGYKINANQELIALGLANIFSSFFLCYPCCASLSRSSVQERVGGRSQLVNLFSCCFMVFILFFLSKYLHTLPKCVLACIITVAIYPIICRITEFKQAWNSSKLDGILWIVTFWIVLFFGVGHGLLYSVGFALFILLVRLIVPTLILKYRFKDTEIFVESNPNHFKTDRENFMFCLTESSDSKIVFEYQGPLIFINALIFRTKFFSMIGCFIVELYERESSFCSKTKTSKFPIDTIKKKSKKRTIILDCSRMIYIDAKGIEAIQEIAKLLARNDAKLVLAACSELIYEKLERFHFFKEFDRMNCYITVIDAIIDNPIGHHHHHHNHLHHQHSSVDEIQINGLDQIKSIK